MHVGLACDTKLTNSCAIFKLKRPRISVWAVNKGWKLSMAASRDTSAEWRQSSPRPNYFVAVQCSKNTQLKNRIGILHSKLTELDKDFSATLEDSASAHITLAVVHIPDADKGIIDSDCSAASELEMAGQVLDNIVVTGGMRQFDLVASNVGSFSDRVVYVDLAEDDGKAYLSELAGYVKQRLHASGVNVTNLNQSFTPHITVAKTSKLWGKHKQNQKLKFTPEVIAQLQSTSSDATEAAGPIVLQITSLQLCRMLGRTPGSYYHIEKESMLQGI